MLQKEQFVKLRNFGDQSVIKASTTFGVASSSSMLFTGHVVKDFIFSLFEIGGIGGKYSWLFLIKCSGFTYSRLVANLN